MRLFHPCDPLFQWYGKLFRDWARKENVSSQETFPPPFNEQTFIQVTDGAEEAAREFAREILSEHLAAKKSGQTVLWDGPSPPYQRLRQSGIELVSAYYDAVMRCS